MRYEVTTHDLPEQPIVSIRKRLPTADMPVFVGEAYGRLFAYLGVLKVEASGAPFIVYHAFGPGDVDAEVCVPVPFVVAEAQGILSRVVDAAMVARTLHVGPYDELGGAYTELTEWVRDHGFEEIGPPRERYLNAPGPEVAPADYRTEIDLPITPAMVAAGAV